MTLVAVRATESDRRLDTKPPKRSSRDSKPPETQFAQH